VLKFSKALWFALSPKLASNVSQLGEVADFEALTFNLELNFF
jgi:hypothetical protein